MPGPARYSMTVSAFTLAAQRFIPSVTAAANQDDAIRQQRLLRQR